jgi:hypothetical protein
MSGARRLVLKCRLRLRLRQQLGRLHRRAWGSGRGRKGQRQTAAHIGSGDLSNKRRRELLVGQRVSVPERGEAQRGGWVNGSMGVDGGMGWAVGTAFGTRNKFGAGDADIQQPTPRAPTNPRPRPRLDATTPTTTSSCTLSHPSSPIPHRSSMPRPKPAAGTLVACAFARDIPALDNAPRRPIHPLEAPSWASPLVAGACPACSPHYWQSLLWLANGSRHACSVLTSEARIESSHQEARWRLCTRTPHLVLVSMSP